MLSRMKGVIHGLKLSQVSIILIGLVCATVLILTCTKTTLLASLTPAQSPLLQLHPVQTDEVSLGEGNTNGVKTEGEDVESAGSSGVELAVNKGNVENSPPTKEGLEKEKVDSVDSTGLELAVDGENIEKLTISKDGREKKKVELVGSTGMDRAVDSENIENLTSNKEGTTPSGAERTGSEELSGGKNKTKPVEMAPASGAIKEESPVQVKQASNSSSTEGCNYAKGKWVFDDDLPLYSGFGCKQWLSSMWACRLTQRADFEYEKLRWQPKDCNMKKFTGVYFLEKMRDKTLAFIGDSLGRQQFQSLMCMATGGEERPDVLDAGHEYGLVKARGAIRPDGWAYRFPTTNTTVLYYWSASLCDLEPIDPSNPATDVAMHLNRPPSFLRRFIHRFDVLVLNTGHHWNRGKLQANKWVMYVDGAPNTDRRIADISGARNLTVHSVVRWVDTQLPLYPRLRPFYRSISPRHFFNGDWNTGGTCDNTTPLSGGKEVEKDESSDPLAEAAVRGTGVGLLDVTVLSELRDEGHISRYSIKGTPGVQDCLHWCLPGVPDTWNEILLARI